MYNHHLFPEAAQLSLSKIETPSKTSDTLTILQSIVRTNDTEPYIGVLWEDAGERVEVYFCFTSSAGAHDFRRSIGAALGSVISYPHIELFDGTGIKSEYTNNLLQNGIRVVLRVSVYSGAELVRRGVRNFNKSDRIKKINWLLTKSLLIKKLLSSKPILTTSAEHSLATLLNRFLSSYTTNSIGALVDTLEQLDTGGYLDARNISFLRLLKMDALGQYSDILMDEDIGDIVRGRMSSEVHRVVLKSLNSVYGLKDADYASVSESNVQKIEALKQKLDDWRTVFKSYPKNMAVFDSSDLTFHSYGRHLLGYETSTTVKPAQANTDESSDQSKLESGQKASPNQATDEDYSDSVDVPAMNSWNSWLSAGEADQDWSEYYEILREEGLNWSVDNVVIEQYLSVLDSLNDDRSARLISGSFAIFTESLYRQFSRNSCSTSYLLRLAEEFALTSHRAQEDYRLYRFMLEMLFANNYHEQDVSNQWQVLEEFIETRGLSVFNLPDFMAVLEFLVDMSPRYDENVLRLWNQYVLPFATNNSRLSRSDFKVLDMIGGYIQEDYTPFTTEDANNDESSLTQVEANIGVYSLDKTALSRVVGTIRAIYPNVTIRENSDSVCTSALDQLSKTSDAVFFAASKAKHAAFYCVQNAKALVRYPNGKGSTAMVRAIEEYLGELAN